MSSLRSAELYLVEVACSACPEVAELVVTDLEEVEALCCDCEYGWIVISISSASES